MSTSSTQPCQFRQDGRPVRVADADFEAELWTEYWDRNWPSWLPRFTVHPDFDLYRPSKCRCSVKRGRRGDGGSRFGLPCSEKLCWDCGPYWVKDYAEHAHHVFSTLSSVFMVSPDGTVEHVRAVYYRQQPPRPPAPDPRPRRKSKDYPKMAETPLEAMARAERTRETRRRGQQARRATRGRVTVATVDAVHEFTTDPMGGAVRMTAEDALVSFVRVALMLSPHIENCRFSGTWSVRDEPKSKVPWIDYGIHGEGVDTEAWEATRREIADRYDGADLHRAADGSWVLPPGVPGPVVDEVYAVKTAWVNEEWSLGFRWDLSPVPPGQEERYFGPWDADAA